MPLCWCTQQTLKRHFPDSPSYTRSLRTSLHFYKPPVSILSVGYPPGPGLSAPTVVRKPWTASSALATTTTGGRQPMKATQEYGLQTAAGEGAKRDSRGRSLATTHHTRLTRSNSLPRNYQRRSHSPLPVYSSHSAAEIRFYNRYDPYYEFTNFYFAPLKIDGKMWPTTEHYFQAQKFVGTPYVEKIRKFSAPREAFQYSRDPAVCRWQRTDWEGVKEDIMLKALRCKFDQHTTLRRMLIETRSKKLIEHTSNDSYWGNGGDGSGRNRLGELLMRVRQELQDRYGTPPSSYQPGSFSCGPPSSSAEKDRAYHGRADTPSENSQRPLSSRRRSSSVSNLMDITHQSPAYHPASPRLTRASAKYVTTGSDTVSKPEPNPGAVHSKPKTGEKEQASRHSVESPAASERLRSLRRRSLSSSELSGRSMAHTTPSHHPTTPPSEYVAKEVETRQRYSRPNPSPKLKVRSKRHGDNGSKLQPRPLPPLPPTVSPTQTHAHVNYNPITHKEWY